LPGSLFANRVVIAFIRTSKYLYMLVNWIMRLSDRWWDNWLLFRSSFCFAKQHFNCLETWISWLCV